MPRLFPTVIPDSFPWTTELRNLRIPPRWDVNNHSGEPRIGEDYLFALAHKPPTSITVPSFEGLNRQS